MARFLDFPRGALSEAELAATIDRLQDAVQRVCEGDRNGDRCAFVLVLQSGSRVHVSANVDSQVQREMLVDAVDECPPVLGGPQSRELH